MASGCRDVLVVAEYAGGQPSGLTYEMLGLARRLVDASGGQVLAVALGRSASPFATELGARGADRVFAVDDSRKDRYEAERWLEVIPTILRQHGPAHVLAGHTALGAELGPRLAFRLGTSVATGCERVELDEGTVTITRPCFGSKAREVLTLNNSPSVVTMRARMSDPVALMQKEAELVCVEAPLDAKELPTKVLGRSRDEAAE